jgi:LacI family transcriptional regulator
VPIDLKKLSAHLGLSPTTVSRALNGYPDVSESTRRRVVDVARELDYQPNVGARRLALGRADAVGIVYPLDAGDLGDPRFLEVVQGVSDRLDAGNIDLLLVSAREKSELQSYERLVRGGRVDGLIVARTRVIDPRIDYLMQSGIPFVAYGRTGTPQGFPWFDFDNEAGMALAVQELVKLGHTAIAYVHAPLTLNFAWQRHMGYERAMQMAGLTVRSDAIFSAGMDRRSGYGVAARILALTPRPTAIIVDNNLCGVGVVRALLDAGIEIGHDISIIVYDGVPVDTLLRGQWIAAVEQPTAYEAGQTMAEMLLSLIAGKTPEPEQHQVLRQPRFVGANSIGPGPTP